MKTLWHYEESISTPGYTQSITKEYQVKIIAIPKKWWSIGEWKRANRFLKFKLEKSIGARKE